MFNRKFAATLATILVSTSAIVGAGCDHEYKKDDPRNPSAPKVRFTSPQRGAIVNNVTSVTVTGNVIDEDGDIETVTLNDVVVPLDANGGFSVNVPVTTGITLLRAVASDKAGNKGKQTQSVMAGEMASVDTEVTDAILTRVSEQAFDAIGRGTARFVQDADLGAMVANMNPVVNAGSGCNFAKANVGAMDVGATSLSLVPRDGAIDFHMVMNDVDVPMQTTYAALCINGASSVRATMSKVDVRGVLTLSVVNGQFSAQVENPDVKLTDFRLDVSGVPGAIINLLNLNAVISPLLATAVERFVVPQMNKALSGLVKEQTTTVMGKEVRISVKPSQIDVDSNGAVVRLDTRFRVAGDELAKGFVYAANQEPNISTAPGLAMAVADDSVNQLFGSLWGAGVMDVKLDLSTGAYGTVGNLFSGIETKGSLPLFVSADGGALKITIGDLIGKFTDTDTRTVTAAAINGEVSMSVESTATGELRLAVGDPKVSVDVLDSADGVEGTNALSTPQFEGLLSFGVSQAVGIAAGAVGTVPLPSFSGISAQNVVVDAQTGYMMVTGELQ
jgi:hypothetical protein